MPRGSRRRAASWTAPGTSSSAPRSRRHLCRDAQHGRRRRPPQPEDGRAPGQPEPGPLRARRNALQRRLPRRDGGHERHHRLRCGHPEHVRQQHPFADGSHRRARGLPGDAGLRPRDRPGFDRRRTAPLPMGERRFTRELPGAMVGFPRGIRIGLGHQLRSPGRHDLRDLVHLRPLGRGQLAGDDRATHAATKHRVRRHARAGTTGPAFNAVPFDPSHVTATAVGAPPSASAT